MRLSVCAFAVLGSSVLFAKADEPVRVVVYSVADLVAELPGGPGNGCQLQAMVSQLELSGVGLSAPMTGESAEEEAIEKNLAELAELIQTIAAPEAWSNAGGPGRIAEHRKSLSLVIRQTDEAHEEVLQLLEQLRRENDVKVEVTFEFLEEIKKPVQQAAYRESPGGPAAFTRPSAAYSGAYAPAQSPQYPAGQPTPYPSVPAQQSQYQQPQLQPSVVQPLPVEPLPVQPVNRAPVPASNANTRLTTPQPNVAVQNTEPAESLQDVVQALAARHGATMNEDELKEFREKIAKSATCQFVQSTTLTNGRSQLVVAVTAKPLISPDRRFIDMYLVSPLVPVFGSTVRIPDGESAVFQLLDGDGGETSVLVTAKIRIPEEEQQFR